MRLTVWNYTINIIKVRDWRYGDKDKATFRTKLKIFNDVILNLIDNSGTWYNCFLTVDILHTALHQVSLQAHCAQYSKDIPTRLF